MVHRLVALNFLNNDNNNKIVDHIDGNKINNCLDNLRWVTPSENVKNGHINNQNYKNKYKSVYKMDKDNNILEKYESVKNAMIENNYTYDGGIIKCCKGKQKVFNGFKWKYVNENNDKNIINKDEYFVDIDKIYDDEYNNKYSISNYGKIRNNNINLIYKLSNSSGYYKIQLIDINGKKKDYLIHRLVAYFFISKENKEKFVNHKDENKNNNYVNNLEWLNTKGENIIYSSGKKIVQIEPKTNKIINTFNTIKEAEKTLNLSVGNISKCINGKRKSFKKYIWKTLN